LQSGLVKIYKLSEDGKEQVLHMVREGETFAGAPIFLHQAKYPASAAAMKPSEVILIPKESLYKTIRENPNIALKILESFAGYLDKLVSLVDDLSLKAVSKRLAMFLFSLAKAKGRKTSDGIVIEKTPTKQDIAARLGTVREVVSRNLSYFQKEGLIKIDNKTIIILDEQGLKEI
jgi:CRP/FNR family transcriptional regulator